MVYSKYHEYQQFILGMEVQQADLLVANSNRWLCEVTKEVHWKTLVLSHSLYGATLIVGLYSPNPSTATITKHGANLHPSPPPSCGSAQNRSFHQLFHLL